MSNNSSGSSRISEIGGRILKEELLQEEKTREERPSRAGAPGVWPGTRSRRHQMPEAGPRPVHRATCGAGHRRAKAKPGAAVLAGSQAENGGKRPKQRSEVGKRLKVSRRSQQVSQPASDIRHPATNPAGNVALPEPEDIGGANANPDLPPTSHPHIPKGEGGPRSPGDQGRAGFQGPQEREPREERPEKREAKEERLEKRGKEEKEELLRALKMLAPGTALREGLESILRAKTGALIVLGDSPEILDLVEGGFRIDTEFTPPNIYELAKMDGAIILSHDAQRILYANTQLVPDPMIFSDETGIRHRTAQRFGIQTGAVVIAISHRRGVITLYKGPMRYILREIEVILSKANQAIQTLERYKRVLDKALVNLTALEFEELVTVMDVAKVVQRGEMVLRIGRELESYIVELGVEGRLVTMQAEELVANVEEELFICDPGLPRRQRQVGGRCQAVPEQLLPGGTAGTVQLQPGSGLRGYGRYSRPGGVSPWLPDSS